MKKTEALLAIEKLEKAYKALKEAGLKSRNDIEKDGTIKRFEFTFELLWKTLKITLGYYGIEANNPRSVIKESFRHGVIEDDEIFLDMLEDRNSTSHMYDEKAAEEIFTRIKRAYIEITGKLIAKLKKEFKKV